MHRDGPQTPPPRTCPAEPFDVMVQGRCTEHRSRLDALLSSSGLRVTAVADLQEALDRLPEARYTALVADAEQGDPLELLGAAREACPFCAVIFLSDCHELEPALALLRAGADDLVLRTDPELGHLADRVTAACHRAEERRLRAELLRETAEFLELFLKKLMDAGREAMLHKLRAGGSSGGWDLGACRVLVVDDNGDTAAGLQAALGDEGEYTCLPALSGGEALDLAGREPFHLALVKDGLPDLPGTMVARGLGAQRPDALVLLFVDRGQEPSRVSLVEDSKTIVLIPQLVQGRQLVQQIHELRDAYVAKLRERRYLDAFRSTHHDFLSRYVALKRRLTAWKSE